MALSLLWHTVQDSFGNAIAGAAVTVRVASTPPGTGALAPIFTDPAGQNQIPDSVAISDALGTIYVYLDAGNYDLVVEAPGRPSRIYSHVTVGAISGGGGGGGASDPPASLGIRYVRPDGSDLNDGLSWANAKKTVLDAYNSLPADGGTIYVTNLAEGGSGNLINLGGDTNQLKILGPQDPNWNNPPTGWVQQKRLNLIGVAGKHHVSFGHMPAVRLDNPTGAALNFGDPTTYQIQLSGTNVPLHFENISFAYPRGAVSIGFVNSANDGNGAETVATSWRNVHFVTESNASNINNALRMSRAYEHRFERCVFNANGNAATDSDERAAILLKANPGQLTVGLTYFTDVNLNSGPLIAYGTSVTGGLSLVIRNVLTEGLLGISSGAAIWIKEATATTTVLVDTIEVADAGTNRRPLKVENAASPSTAYSASVVALRVRNLDDCEGPILWLSESYRTGISGRSTLTSRRQGGFRWLWDGIAGASPILLDGQHDGARRGFSPAAVRYANLATQDPAAWSSMTGSATVTTGIEAPDGSRRAVRLSSGSGIQSRAPYRVFGLVTAGEWWIGGAWVRSASSSTGFQAPVSLSHTPSGDITWDEFGSSGELVFAVASNRQYWQWVPFAVRMASAPTTSVAVQLAIRAAAGAPVDVYGPVLFRVPDTEISREEAMELALHSRMLPFLVAGKDAASEVAADDFNRADGAPGADYSTLISGAFVISGNRLRSNSTDSNNSILRTGTFAADQYVEWTVAGIPDPANTALFGGVLRGFIDGSSQPNGYLLRILGHTSLPPAWEIRRLVGGVATTLPDGAPGGVTRLAVAVGDRIRFEVRGTRLRVYRNEQLVREARDASLTSGNPGFIGQSAGNPHTNNYYFDDASFGNLTPDPGTTVSLSPGQRLGIGGTDSNHIGVFDHAITQTRKWMLPDKNGTVALASDIPTVFPVVRQATVTTGSTGANTTETDLQSLTIPGGTLTANAVLRITAVGVVTGTANTKAVRLYWGTQQVASLDFTAGQQSDWGIEVLVLANNSVAAQKFWSQGLVYGTATQNTASDVVVRVTGLTPDAADEVTSEFLVIEYLRA